MVAVISAGTIGPERLVPIVFYWDLVIWCSSGLGTKGFQDHTKMRLGCPVCWGSNS